MTIRRALLAIPVVAALVMSGPAWGSLAAADPPPTPSGQVTPSVDPQPAVAPAPATDSPAATTPAPYPPQGSSSPTKVPSKQPHPHKTSGPVAPKQPHPHKTPGPVPPKRDHPHRAPWPITLTVKTVPALPGAQFSVDGTSITTDAAGVATYTAQHDFAAHTVVILSATVNQPGKRYQFSRWAGQRNPQQAFDHTVTGLPLRADYAITAAFAEQQQVTPHLVTENQEPLDVSRVTAITAKSDSGQIVSLPVDGGTWLDAIRPVYHNSSLTAQSVSYSLQTVVVQGANVVDSGRQSFKPSVTSTPTVVTQFHNLSITGHDALFNSAQGSAAVVTYPDGSQRTVPLTAHVATLTDLPRGTYSVVVRSGSAIVSSDQFSLSKDKTADIAVISVLDLLILITAVLLVAFALFAIGRHQHWRARLAKRIRRPARSADLSAAN